MEELDQKVSIDVDCKFEGQIEFLEETVAVELVSVIDDGSQIAGSQVDGDETGIVSIPVSLEAEAVLDFVDGHSVVDLTSYGLGYEADVPGYDVNNANQVELNFAADVLTIIFEDHVSESVSEIII
ncbi:MAG: hypothetical protein ACR2OR_00480 [Hyphomicrobiales bacterium]